MLALNVNGKEYKVKFGYNSFCDTDLMDRTEALMRVFATNGAENDKDVATLGKVRELFCCIRELLFAGFKKYNPVETVQEVGDIIDDYHDEIKDGEKRDIMSLFETLTMELLDEGFLKELLTTQQQEEKPKTGRKTQK